MVEATRIDGAAFARKAGLRNLVLIALMAAVSFAFPATCAPDACASGKSMFPFAPMAIIFFVYLGAIALVTLPRLQETRLTRAAVVPVTVALLPGVLFIAAIGSVLPAKTGLGVGANIPPGLMAGLASLVTLSLFTPSSITDERNGKMHPAAMALVIMLALAAIAALFIGLGAVVSPPLVAWMNGHTWLLTAHKVILYASPLIMAALVSDELRKLYRHGDSTIWLWLGGVVGLLAMLIALYFTVLHAMWLGASIYGLNLPPLKLGPNRSALQLVELLSLLVLPVFLARVTYGANAKSEFHARGGMTGSIAAPWRARLEAGSKAFGRRTA
jgi:hypothetical protein